MKKKISIILTALLLLSTIVVNAEPDATAAASTKTEAAAPAKPAATIANGSKVHTVIDGDCMWNIAVKYGLSLDQLIALNPQIKNPDLIFPGDQVVVGVAAPTTAPTTSTPPVAINATKLYQGSGQTVVFRNGPGKDAQGVPVYSFTIVMANATFDANGRIVNSFIDSYEVSSPNYDGKSMPHFTGWPGASYNNVNHETEKIDVKTSTLDSATAEVQGWKTKRERGDSYGMNPTNDWHKQMDFYQNNLFKGKTIAELKDWYAKYTTTAGRPIKANTTNEADLAKYNKLTASEKAALADVVAGATMSLNDPHGKFIDALENAYNNRVEMVIPTK